MFWLRTCMKSTKLIDENHGRKRLEGAARESSATCPIGIDSTVSSKLHSLRRFDGHRGLAENMGQESLPTFHKPLFK